MSFPSHGLWYEGAPHDDRGHRTNGVGVSGDGRAKCRCGAMSEVLPSANQRKAWHRTHKAEIAAQAAAAAGPGADDPSPAREGGSSLPGDRRVHVTIVPSTGGPKIEIVRYERSGKWYYESGLQRRHLRIVEAVDFAKDRPAVIWHEGLPGGMYFDAQVRRLRAGAR